MSYYDRYKDVKDLIGLTFSSVTQRSDGDSIFFRGERSFKLYHSQD